MIDGIHIKNFRAILDLKLVPKKLTLLMGPNGSGKSSVLMALAFLAQQNGDSPIFDGDIIKMKSFHDVVFQKEASNKISIEVSLKLTKEELSTIEKETINTPYQMFDFSSIRMEVSIGLVDRGGVRPSVSFYTNDNELIGSRVHSSGNNYQINFNSRISVNPFDAGSVNDIWNWRFSSGSPKEPVHVSIADNARDIFRNIILNQIYYFAPSRKVDDRLEEITDRDVIRITSEGKNTLALLLYTKVNQEIQFKKIARWMKEFSISEVYSNLDRNLAKVAFGDDKLSTKVDAPELGFGSNQLLPVIVQMFACKPNSILMVEEPEMSLHTSAQVKLPYLFSEILDENKQIIVTTHSTFLPIAIGKATRDGKCSLSRKDIQIFEFDKGIKGTKISTLLLNEQGNIENWIPGVAKVEDMLYTDWAKSLPEDI